MRATTGRPSVSPSRWGGNYDTIAAIAGGIAGAYHGVPSPIRDQALDRLDDHLRGVVEEFEAQFPPKRP